MGKAQEQRAPGDGLPGPVALIAGLGALPGLIAKAMAARGESLRLTQMHGFGATFAPDLLERQPEGRVLEFHLERLVPFLDHLHETGIKAVCFAGAMRRPRLEPGLIDARTAQLLPKLMAAMQGGDDATLRAVIALFEEWGFAVLAAQDLAPDLLPGAGVLAGAPSAQDQADAARAAQIVAALGAVDVGQGAVVAGGLCLAVESLPGTDAMLDWVAATAPALRGPAGGVFYKAPKPGQDLRVDLPAIGPETVARAQGAGLAGLAWQAGGVLLLDQKATIAAAEDAGLFLWARPA